jgi:ParB family transcriptional regulator, chromosome partitioning protein
MPTSASNDAQVKNPERARDKIAEQVGFGSGKTYESAKKVWDSAKDGDETAKELMKKLTNKNMKISIFCKRF